MNLNGEVTSLADSPCTGNCTARQWGDLVCKGCGRTEEDIQNWSSYPEVRRKIRVLEISASGYPTRHTHGRFKRTDL